MSRDGCLELARRTNRDPDEIIDWWLERAAIREFEGGQPRAQAELDAFEDIRSALESAPLIGGARRGPQQVRPADAGRTRKATES